MSFIEIMTGLNPPGVRLAGSASAGFLFPEAYRLKNTHEESGIVQFFNIKLISRCNMQAIVRHPMTLLTSGNLIMTLKSSRLGNKRNKFTCEEKLTVASTYLLLHE